jgi:branched-chain amino acid transport system substrate-binding protein
MMSVSRRGFIAAATASAALPRAAREQAARIRIGLLTDLSGPYRDTGGISSIACARQAIAEAKGSMDVELLVADHQQKTDVGLGIARQWLDRDGVDVIIDVNNSAIALAVAGLVRDKDRMHLNTGAATSDLTGSACNPNTAAWTTDTWCRAHGTAGAVLQGGGKTWFFITADYAFGHSIQQDAAKVITAAGGRIVGTAQYPFPATSDFSAMLVQAGDSGADVIAFANTGSDLANCVKQAREFGLPKAGQRLVAMSGYITDVHAIGIEDGQGLVLTENFYWDLNPRTRAFAARVHDATIANWPSTAHAASYAATLHYLKVAADMGAAQAKASGAATMAAMKRRPTDDDCFGAGVLRADGRKIHPAYLFQVKTPKTSTGPWDLYTVAETIPADQAFRPLSEGACKMAPV